MAGHVSFNFIIKKILYLQSVCMCVHLYMRLDNSKEKELCLKMLILFS